MNIKQLLTLDIHRETAKRMFGTENVTSEMRLIAKRKNYLELFGGRDAHVPVTQHEYLIPVEMKEFMESFDVSEFEKRLSIALKEN